MSNSEGEELTSLPPFIKSLYSILQDDKNAHIISWTNRPVAGEKQRFRVKSASQLASVILPQHFRHTKLSSFMRQLNNYGFSKVKLYDPSIDHDETYGASAECLFCVCVRLVVWRNGVSIRLSMV
jgi:hypothetical protein